jgi:NarL family two-component system response regulator LiaR
MTEKIRVLVVDDHEIVREGLRTILALEPDIELIGEAKDGVEAVEKALALSPDVILIDLVMPRKDGIQAIREIKAQTPDVRILVLTSFAEDSHVFPAIEAGALGFMLKDTTSATLIQAIHIVYRDEPSLHPTVARKLMAARSQKAQKDEQVEPLTNREQQILALLAKGLTNQSIADQLVLSELTVRTHVSNILAKLNLENRTQAALYALRHGMADLDS